VKALGHVAQGAVTEISVPRPERSNERPPRSRDRRARLGLAAVGPPPEHLPGGGVYRLGDCVRANPFTVNPMLGDLAYVCRVLACGWIMAGLGCHLSSTFGWRCGLSLTRHPMNGHRRIQ